MGVFGYPHVGPTRLRGRDWGDYSAPYTEATGIWGLAGEVKYLHTVFLFCCSVTSYYKATQSNVSSLSYSFHGSEVQTQLT